MRQLILIASLFLTLVPAPGGAFSQNITESDQAKNEIVLLTYNVRNCRGIDNITDYQRVADIINGSSHQIISSGLPIFTLTRKID